MNTLIFAMCGVVWYFSCAMFCLTAVIFMRIKIFLISASLLFVLGSGRTYAGDTLPATVGPETPHWSVTWKRLNMSGPVMPEG